VRILGEQVQLTIQVSGANLLRVYGGSDLLWESPDLSLSGRTFNQTVSILVTRVYGQLALRAANEAGVNELPCTPTTLLPDGTDPGPRLAPEIKE